MLNGREVYQLFKEGFKAGDEVVFTRQHGMLWCGGAGWVTTTRHLYKPYKVDRVYGRDGKKIKIQGSLYNPDGMKLYKKGNYSALFETGDKVRCILKDKSECAAKRRGDGWVYNAVRTVRSVHKSETYPGTYMYYVMESNYFIYEEYLTLIPEKFKKGDIVRLANRNDSVLFARFGSVVGCIDAVAENYSDVRIALDFPYWINVENVDLVARDGVIYIGNNTNKTITDDVIEKEEEEEMDNTKVIGIREDVLKVFKSSEDAKVVSEQMDNADLGTPGSMTSLLLEQNKEAILEEAKKRKADKETI